MMATSNNAKQHPIKRGWEWVLLALLVGLLFVPWLGGPPAHRVTRIPYSTFIQYLDSERVAHVDVGATDIHGVLRRPNAGGDTAFVTTRVDPTLVAELRHRGVVFSGDTSGGFIQILGAVFPMLALIAFWFWISRHPGGRTADALSFGKSRTRVYVERDTKVTFEDVAGVDEAKAELQEVVEFLRNPASFGRLGARIPKGVLLVGPPGTGKTLLARAVAGQAAVPFFSINGSEFVELFVGVGAARVRDLFERARTTAPCIVFIDEIDALGRTRGGAAASGTNDEKEQTLNQLLAEMDGFDPRRGVIVLAATNRPEILDPALLRAGRFDRQIVVDRPDRAGRVQILRVHVKNVHVAPDLDLDQVAALTPGFTGADLANLVNEAALDATRRNADAVSLADFTVAVERIVAGLARKSRVLTPREREITAYHEMGHAVVALATPGADPVHKVSIIPRGLAALGYTLQRPAEDRYIATRAELEGKMTVMFGGRAAELAVFGELSTGAADDLMRATELAREMVMRYGMDDVVGNVVYGERAAVLFDGRVPVAPESRLYSEQTARDIESAVRTLLQHALDRAVAVLTLNRPALDRGARLLQEQETLTRDQLPVVSPAPAEAVHPRASLDGCTPIVAPRGGPPHPA